MAHWANEVARSKATAKAKRAAFLEAFARTGVAAKALAEIDRKPSWLYHQCAQWADFSAAYKSMRHGGVVGGENRETPSRVDWDGTFASFDAVFLDRVAPWFHVQLCETLEKMTGGDIALIIWPPEHAKTSLLEDFSTYRLAQDPTTRITVGKEKIDMARKFVGTVKNRFEPSIYEYWKLRERFGPFAPMNGRNHAGQPQKWAEDGFDVFKRTLGAERDYNMQALGINSSVVGSRCDIMVIDDAQSRKTLSQTDKLLETIRDDWFSRPGTTGFTVILMNVVGDDDIGERLYNAGSCDHVSILKAYDERYLELGPRRHTDGSWVPSPWLWPEYYDERSYQIKRKNAGEEGWARKYQQDWRPAVARTFTKEMIDKCANPLRSVEHPPPKKPDGKDAHVEVSLDPGFGRTAVCAAAFEPTIMRVLDSRAQANLRTPGQMIDMVLDQVRAWNRPGISKVTHVVVETKGFQRGLITDDAFLEARDDYGFEIVEQQTGWDKHDEDFGVAQMSRSMLRGELDFPAKDSLSVEHFAGLYKEMHDWRPEIRGRNRGNKLRQDELMALWFLWTRWHKQRRRSIRRGSDATQFGFASLPTLGKPAAPVDLSKWRFGSPIGAR